MLPAKALVDRELLAQHVQLCDKLGMSPEHQFRLDPQLDGAEAQLLEAACLELERERAGHVGIRVAAPQRECRPELLCGLGGSGLHQSARLLDRPLELRRIDVLRLGDESIAAVVADDHVAHRGPEVRDVRLQRRARACGRLIAPNAVDQGLDGDRLSDLRGQQREDGALLRAAQADVDAVVQDFEGSEDENVHSRTIRRLCGRA